MIEAIELDAAMQDELSRNGTPEMTALGPLSAAATMAALRASDCYSYGKDKSALVKYVGESVEAPVAKVATVAHHTVAPAIKFVDNCLSLTTSVVCKPVWFVAGVYGKLLKTCDTTIDYFLPSEGAFQSPSSVSVRGCIGKVCTRLPQAVVDGTAYGRQAVLSAPSRACDVAHAKTLVLRDGVYARYTQVCDISDATLHTTIETVNGQTTAAFAVVQSGVHSCVVAPISASLLWADGKLGLSRALTQASEFVSRTVERLLRHSISQMLAAMMAQLANVAVELRASVQQQIDVLLTVLRLSSKPAIMVPVTEPHPFPSVASNRTYIAMSPTGDITVCDERGSSPTVKDRQGSVDISNDEEPVHRSATNAGKNPSPPKYPRLRSRPTPTSKALTPLRTATPPSRRNGSGAGAASDADPARSANSYLQQSQPDSCEPFEPFVLRFQ